MAQSAIQDDSATHARRDDHAQQVVRAATRAAPALAQRQRLGVVVDDAAQAEGLTDPIAQRKPTPGGDVQRADDSLGVAHRPATAHADRDRGYVRLGQRASSQLDERLEHAVGVARTGRRGTRLAKQRTFAIDHARG